LQFKFEPDHSVNNM